MSVIGYRLSVVGYRLSVVGYRLSVIGCRLSVAEGRLRPSATHVPRTERFLFFNHETHEIHEKFKVAEGRLRPSATHVPRDLRSFTCLPATLNFQPQSGGTSNFQFFYNIIILYHIFPAIAHYEPKKHENFFTFAQTISRGAGNADAGNADAGNADAHAGDRTANDRPERT